MTYIDQIIGDAIPSERASKKDFQILEGERGGVEFRVTQAPLDWYVRRGNITKEEYRAGDRLFRDFYLSGQTVRMTPIIAEVRLPRNEDSADLQMISLQSHRDAIASVKGKIGQLMVLNVCCHGMFLHEINYMPYKAKQSMPRFREALADLMTFYNIAEKY